MGGKINDVVCMSIHTTCGMNAYLYHIVGLSMLASLYVGAALPTSFSNAAVRHAQRTNPTCCRCYSPSITL